MKPSILILLVFTTLGLLFLSGCDGGGGGEEAVPIVETAPTPPGEEPPPPPPPPPPPEPPCPPMLEWSKEEQDCVCPEGYTEVNEHCVQGYTLYIIVADAETGDPLRDADIVVSNEFFQSKLALRTNAIGQAEFTGLMPEMYDYYIYKKGYGPVNGRVKIVDSDVVIDVALTIQQFLSASFVVTDAFLDNPIEGATVQVGESGFTPYLTERTNAEGTAVFSSIQSGDYDYVAFHNTFAIERGTVTLVDTDITTEIRLSCAPGFEFVPEEQTCVSSPSEELQVNPRGTFAAPVTNSYELWFSMYDTILTPPENVQCFGGPQVWCDYEATCNSLGFLGHGAEVLFRLIDTQSGEELQFPSRYQPPCAYRGMLQFTPDTAGKTYKIMLQVQKPDGSVVDVDPESTFTVQPDTIPPHLESPFPYYLLTTLPLEFFVKLGDYSGIAEAKVIVEEKTATGQIKEIHEIMLHDDGTHNDAGADDGWFGGRWDPAVIPPEYTIRFLTKDTLGNEGTQAIVESNRLKLIEAGDDFACDKIVDNGPSNEKINVFLIPMGYDQNDLAQTDFSAYPNHLFSIEPFNSMQNEFNFYVLRSPDGFTYDLDNDVYLHLGNLLVNACGVASDEVDQIARLVKRSDRSYAWTNNMVTFTPNPINYANVNVFAHEFGHSFGLLIDEYWAPYDRTYAGVSTTYPPPYWGANTQYEGCAKWCAGALDTNSLFYPYYEGWKGCVTPYLTNKYWNEENRKALELCWNDWNQRLIAERPAEDFYALNQIPLGVSCQPELDCYFTSHSINLFRPTKTSIMVNNIGTYGAISEQSMAERIQTHATGHTVEVFLPYLLSPRPAQVLFWEETDDLGRIVRGGSISPASLPEKLQRELVHRMAAREIQRVVTRAEPGVPAAPPAEEEIIAEITLPEQPDVLDLNKVNPGDVIDAYLDIIEER